MFVSSLLRILEDLLQCPDEEVMLRATDLVSLSIQLASPFAEYFCDFSL